MFFASNNLRDTLLNCIADMQYTYTGTKPPVTVIISFSTFKELVSNIENYGYFNRDVPFTHMDKWKVDGYDIQFIRTGDIEDTKLIVFYEHNSCIIHHQKQSNGEEKNPLPGS